MIEEKLYDINKTFEENIAFGPNWNRKLPIIPKSGKKFSFLGKKLNSLFGVSACPLTHGSRAVSLCSKLGFDIITYRSVRSIEWHGQKFPHWCYVSIPKQLAKSDLTLAVKGSFNPFTKQEISTANSFGIQSLKPDYWKADFEIAKKNITPGQILILSLMFTPEEGKDVIDDSKLVAKYAKETSAEVFEINLAHPNSGMKSLVYEDVGVSVAICKMVKKVLGDRPLLAKVGYYRDIKVLESFLKKTKGVIDGVTSANTYAMSVINNNNDSFFPNRPKAGVSGGAIRSLYLEQTEKIVELKDLLKLKNFVIIGVGGVTKPNHIEQYLSLGVDAVQAAAGAWADPYLAVKYKEHIA